MNKTKRIEELIEQAKREQEEPMAKKIHRIEVLEQRVAELMGQVERLQAEVKRLNEQPYDMRPVVTHPSETPGFPGWPPVVTWRESPYPWTIPGTVWPHEIASSQAVTSKDTLMQNSPTERS